MTLLPFNLLCSINSERKKVDANFFFIYFKVVKRKDRTIILYNVAVVVVDDEQFPAGIFVLEGNRF